MYIYFGYKGRKLILNASFCAINSLLSLKDSIPSKAPDLFYEPLYKENGTIQWKRC
uniref:Uncharacterized protein n=1 Tax=Anguilla anguilla TaxID=7936 RepID=A0A0E9WR34_ANGAN